MIYIVDMFIFFRFMVILILKIGFSRGCFVVNFFFGVGVFMCILLIICWFFCLCNLIVLLVVVYVVIVVLIVLSRVRFFLDRRFFWMFLLCSLYINLLCSVYLS